MTIGMYSVVWQNLQKERQIFLNTRTMDYTLPSGFVLPATLEFKGIVSDFLFLKMITFLGERIGQHETFGSDHANYIKTSVDTITDLDPYFWDAYLFANMMLTWDVGEYELANDLLLKAMAYRENDFRIPYFIGFNYFYFMHDNDNGAKYLMKASEIPGSPPYLATLAARLSVYALQHKTAITFLKKMLDDTQNEKVARQLALRIKTLIALDQLEQKVAKYKNKYQQMPSSIEQLVTSGLMDEIPEEPYGGKFVLLDNGRVYTTSKMVKIKKTTLPES